MEGGHYSELPLCGEFALAAKRGSVSCALATASDFLSIFFSCFKMTLFFSFLINNPGGGWSEKMVMKKCQFYNCAYFQTNIQKETIKLFPLAL